MNLANAHFAEPQWLWFALLAPLVLIGLQSFAARARRRQLSAIAAPEVLGDLTRSHSPARRAIKNALLVLATAGVGIALARPQWGVLEFTAQALGDDVVFAVDCSRSMLATDIRPNRLERAKAAVMEFVRRHARGRVGLVAFAGQAFLQCPLTLDYDAFEEALRALSDRTIPVPGTDIGRALDESFQAMDKADRKKIVVLLTDGEDLEGSGRRTAEALAGKGGIVFTIGVGTAAGAEIQYQDDQGRPELVRDGGNPVRSRLDEATLRAIAESTKGNYFPLGVLGEGLAKVRLAVEGADAVSASGPVRRMGVDRFHIPIAAVLALLIVESLMGTRRRMKDV